MRLAAILWLATTGAAFADESWPYQSEVDACYARESVPSASGTCIGNAATLCMDSEDGGYSTAGMANCVIAEKDVWDALLNAEYAKARMAADQRDAAYRDTGPAFANSAASLLAAQRAWIAFRDANCAMQRDAWGNGSMRITASANCFLHMTAERTFELRGYADLGG